MVREGGGLSKKSESRRGRTEKGKNVIFHFCVLTFTSTKLIELMFSPSNRSLIGGNTTSCSPCFKRCLVLGCGSSRQTVILIILVIITSGFAHVAALSKRSSPIVLARSKLRSAFVLAFAEKKAEFSYTILSQEKLFLLVFNTAND